MSQARTFLIYAVSTIAILACESEDPTVPEPAVELVELVVEGNGRADVTGRVLAEPVRVRAVMSPDTVDFHGRIFLELVSGGGAIESAGQEADAEGEIINPQAAFGEIEFDWLMGPPGEQRVRAFALATAEDTVEVEITAMSAEPAPLGEMVVTGGGQSAPAGELLPDTLHAQALLENGFAHLGQLYVEILAGNGLVDVGGSRGRGAGTTLGKSTDRQGRISFVWTMGTAGTEHRVRVYAVEGTDTVSAEVTATSLTPAG